MSKRKCLSCGKRMLRANYCPHCAGVICDACLAVHQALPQPITQPVTDMCLRCEEPLSVFETMAGQEFCAACLDEMVAEAPF